MCLSFIGGSCHKQHFCRDKHVFCRHKNVFVFHWRELPQVAFLSRRTRVLSPQKCVCLSLAGAATSSIFVATNTCFVATKMCLSFIGGSCHKQHFCRDKHVFCRHKNVFVFHWRELPQAAFLSRQTRVLSPQKCVCLSLAGAATSSIFVATNTCFVATKMCLSFIGGSCHKQHFCRDKHVFCRHKNVFVFHWRELPQAAFLSRQTRVLSPQKCVCLSLAGAATSSIFVATKICLSRQTL